MVLISENPVNHRKAAACTMDEMGQIQALRASYKLQIFVVSTWLSSSHTAHLRTMFAEPLAGAWKKMSIQQLPAAASAERDHVLS
jgi:hypothetical protein